MKIKIKEKGYLAIIELHGMQDDDDPLRLRTFLWELIKKKHTRYIIFNLEQLEYLSVHIASIMLAGEKAIKKFHGKIILCHISPSIMYEIKNSYFTQCIANVANEAQALELCQT